MRFIFATDFHIMGGTPASRIDNYPETINNKIDEIFKIAQKQKADFIVLGGDLFEVYNASISVIRRTVKVFQNRSIPVFSVLGNHDLYGHTIKTFHRSAASIMEAAGVMTFPDFESKHSLYFLHYYTGLEDDLNKANKKPSLPVQEALDSSAMIWVIHAMINTSKLTHVSRSIEIDNVRVSPDVKLVLSGDYHIGFETTKREDGVIFVNPGAVSRRNAIKGNFERDAQVAIIDYDPLSSLIDIGIDYVKLESALPADKVFNLEEIKTKKEDKQEIFSYIEKLQNIDVADGIDNLENQIRTFAVEAELDKDVLNEIMVRLYSD